MKKAEEEKLLKKYIDGYNNNEEDLFKKIMNEKRNMDAIKKNQKFYEDNENLKININKSIKIYLNKKRERNLNKKENFDKEKNDNNIKNKNKIKKFIRIKNKENDCSENKNCNIEKEEEKEKEKEKEYIEEIKKMENEEDLFDAILA